jgi:hypothetical protein
MGATIMVALFRFVEENCGTAAVAHSGFWYVSPHNWADVFPCSKQAQFSQIGKTQIKGAATRSVKNERIENQRGLKHP